METGQPEKKSYAGGGVVYPFLATLLFCLLSSIGAAAYFAYSGRLPWAP